MPELLCTPVVLACSFFWWCGLAFFPLPAERSCFPRSACTASPSSLFSACLGSAGGSEPKAESLSPSPLPTGGHCHTGLLTKAKAEHRDGGSSEPRPVFFSSLWCDREAAQLLSQFLHIHHFTSLCFVFFFYVPVFGKHRWSREQDQTENKVNISPFHCISGGLVWLSPRLHKSSLCATADRI